MKKVTVQYPVFYSPGSFTADSWSGEAVDGVIDPRIVEFPANAYAFDICERTDVIDDDGTVFRGAVRTLRQYWHPASRVTTVADVKAMDDTKNNILVRNMECNGWSAVVWSRWNNWPQPWNETCMEVLR